MLTILAIGLPIIFWIVLLVIIGKFNYRHNLLFWVMIVVNFLAIWQNVFYHIMQVMQRRDGAGASSFLLDVAVPGAAIPVRAGRVVALAKHGGMASMALWSRDL